MAIFSLGDAATGLHGVLRRADQIGAHPLARLKIRIIPIKFQNELYKIKSIFNV